MLSCHFRLLATHIVSECRAAWRPALSDCWKDSDEARGPKDGEKSLWQWSEVGRSVRLLVALLTSLFSLCPKGLPFATRWWFKQSRENHTNSLGTPLELVREAVVALKRFALFHSLSGYACAEPLACVSNTQTETQSSLSGCLSPDCHIDATFFPSQWCEEQEKSVSNLPCGLTGGTLLENQLLEQVSLHHHLEETRTVENREVNTEIRPRFLVYLCCEGTSREWEMWLK